MSRFRILCEVSGGVTGNRRGYLKRNGKLMLFDTQADADAGAADLNKNMNGKHATASYRYTVEDYMTGAELLATHTYKGQEALDLD